MTPLPTSLNFLVPIGGEGLLLVVGHPSSTPFTLRISLAFTRSSVLAKNGLGGWKGISSRAEVNVSEPAETSWQILGPGEPIDDGGLGPVCGIAPITMGPETTQRLYSDEHMNQEKNITSDEERRPARVAMTDGASRPFVSEPKQEGVRGLRAVLAVGTPDGTKTNSIGDPKSALHMLEYGMGLSATEGSGGTGLPAGSMLFAEPLDTPSESGVANGRRAESEATPPSATCTRDNAVRKNGSAEGDYVLLMSDRARSRTHVMDMSRDGEIAPAVIGEKVRQCSHASRETKIVWPW